MTVSVTEMTGDDRVILGCTWDLTSKLLEGLALGLGDEESGEETEKHEEREDLEDVVEPWGGCRSCWCAALAEGSDDDLGDDGTDFAGGGGDTVGGRAVAGREAFSRDDESGSVRA